MYPSQIPHDGVATSYDQHPPWNQPSGHAQHPPPPKLPHNHEKFFFTFTYNAKTGEVSRTSSPSLIEFSHNSLDAASEEFRRYIQNNVLVRPLQNTALNSHYEAESYPHGGHADYMNTDDGTKRSRSETLSAEGSKRDKVRPHKSRRLKSETNIAAEIGVQPNATISSQPEQDDIVSEKIYSFKVSETSEWEKWFGNAFRHIQQIGCRTIAKEWIKVIHPKKQSTHPYNGKKLKTGTSNPESTRPPYWPESIIHKEPDHINKEERTNLLVRLLMGTPHKVVAQPGSPDEGKEVDAQALMLALNGKYEDKKHGLRDRRHYIERIIDIRKQLESYEAGGLDANTQLEVSDLASMRRHCTTDDDGLDDTTDEILDINTQDDDQTEDLAMSFTPISPDEPSHTSDLPVLSEVRKNGVRVKGKKKFKQQDLHYLDTGLTARPDYTGMRSQFPPGYDMVHPPSAQMYNGSPISWASTVQTPSGPIPQYQYSYMKGPEQRMIHTPNAYPGDEFAMLPASQQIYPGMPDLFSGPTLMNVPYNLPQQPEDYNSNMRAYFR